jgi:hypothetical protein
MQLFFQITFILGGLISLTGFVISVKDLFTSSRYTRLEDIVMATFILCLVVLFIFAFTQVGN